eukprot:scaffold306_cov525-Prasinococcus_capsulatus_cf.AAC.46
MVLGTVQVNSYVVEDREGTITDFVSFYWLCSTVIGHERHKRLEAAYSYYNVHTKTPYAQLINDALIKARDLKYVAMQGDMRAHLSVEAYACGCGLAMCRADVFNMLEVMENRNVLDQLKFGRGDGSLHYYLFNWRVVGNIEPQEVGLVLL